MFLYPRKLAAVSLIAVTMFRYPVQRHRLPEIAFLICSSVGLLTFLSRPYADMSIPGVQ